MNTVPKKPTSGHYPYGKVPAKKKNPKMSDPVVAHYYPYGSNFDNWVSGFETGSEMWFKYGKALGICQGIATMTLVIVGGDILREIISKAVDKHEHNKKVKELQHATASRRDIHMRAHEPHRTGDKDPTYFQVISNRDKEVN